MIASGHTNIHVPSRRIRFACWISVDLIEPSAFFALYYQVIITILSIVEPRICHAIRLIYNRCIGITLLPPSSGLIFVYLTVIYRHVLYDPVISPLVFPY